MPGSAPPPPLLLLLLPPIEIELERERGDSSDSEADLSDNDGDWLNRALPMSNLRGGELVAVAAMAMAADCALPCVMLVAPRGLRQLAAAAVDDDDDDDDETEVMG